jgi:hypothetical protein
MSRKDRDELSDAIGQMIDLDEELVSMATYAGRLLPG